MKTKILKVRATPEQSEQVGALAQQAGMTKSALILTSVIHGRPCAIKRADPALLRHIAQAGNNLNQIARACNYRAKVGEPIGLVEVNFQLRQIRQQLSSYAPNL